MEMSGEVTLRWMLAVPKANSRWNSQATARSSYGRVFVASTNTFRESITMLIGTS